MKTNIVKSTLSIAAMLLVLSGSAYGWSGLDIFEAYIQNGKIVVEWQTRQEQDVDHFILERSMNSSDSFYELAKVSPHGSGWAYIYIDDKVLGKSASMVYNYRLKIVFRDKSIAYSKEPVRVIMEVTSLRHTWGSIKAMFQ
jgi:hypothetical protein